MKMIRCLTIKQPWAWLIVAGHKTLENRTWSTGYRGPLLIHAAARPDADANWFMTAVAHDTGIQFPDRLPLGSIVGQVNMTGVTTYSRDYWFDGPNAFIFEDATQFERPFPYKGQLGFYNVPWPQPATKATIKYFTPKLIPRADFLSQLKRLAR